jgi:hypothetical protein
MMMKKTAGILAMLLALGLGMAGCSGKDDSAEQAQGTMENAAGDMNQAATESQEAATDQAADAGMMSGDAGSMEAAPTEAAPAEGQ